MLCDRIEKLKKQGAWGNHEAEMAAMDRRNGMNDWEERFVKEHRELDDRITKLQAMLYRYASNSLDFTPKCSLEIFTAQLTAMLSYRAILEIRAKIEGIELSAGN